MASDPDLAQVADKSPVNGVLSARMLEQALKEAHSPEQAREIIRQLHRLGDTPAVGPEGVVTAADGIRAAAARMAAARPPEGGFADQNVLRVTNPPAAGGGRTDLEPHRRRLRQALVDELLPYQAVDTAIFLEINGLPHPRWANSLMRALTIVMKRGDAIVFGLFVAALRDPRRGARALAGVLPPLWLTTAIMEVPVKRFFHRRRPFIDVVRATVVGRRPGSFSFPSGHSAAAFAGATLLRRHYPRGTAAFYLLAVTVGFSRIYLGAHYPGDVVIGGLGGTVLAEVSRAALSKPSRGLASLVYPVLRGVALADQVNRR